MFIESHERSNYYCYLQSVEGRQMLDEVDQLNYRNYIKGFEGEKKFETMLSKCGGIKLWDVALRTPALSQYDFLVIYNHTLFHFEVKNFSGQYRILNNQFVSDSDYVHHDVLSQLNRAHYNLTKFLVKHGIDFKVVSKIIFINDGFTLIGGVEHQDIVTSSSVEKIGHYFDDAYIPDITEKKLGDLLVSKHEGKNIFERIYYYDFSKMKKGMRCPDCRKIGIEDHLKGRNLKCECGSILNKAKILKITIEEIMMLKRAGVSTREVVNWTGLNKRVVRRCLVEHFHAEGKGKARKFTIK
ncbi:nuclease-related domain-containing protein [Macrococcus brunensis]|uniref:nuclease-related domain-containing protein n=2 Tax=Macrococcus brunensis TaxID=198483 RepID=UPI001EF130F9|nr:nuclease-related domain-containing protein [Macrococcus brunensis]ULG72924.1 NERD domain-containing protein [Macrococcus brunensis]